MRTVIESCKTELCVRHVKNTDYRVFFWQLQNNNRTVRLQICLVSEYLFSFFKTHKQTAYLLTYLLTCLLTYLLTYLLIPWCRVRLEKLTGLQLVKKSPAFHGTRTFITALTSVRHLSLSWASPIQSIYPNLTS